MSKENLNKLLELIKENPDLPVIPMVASTGIIGDEFILYWDASFGQARIDEYVISREGEEFLYFKSFCDDDDLAHIILEYEGIEDLTREELNAKKDKIPWKKAIFVNIETPEDEL